MTDTEIYFEGEKLDWVFHEILLDSDHCVAVAFNSGDREKITFKELSFEQLMDKSVPLLENDEEFCRKYFTKLERPN